MIMVPMAPLVFALLYFFAGFFFGILFMMVWLKRKAVFTRDSIVDLDKLLNYWKKRR